MTPRRERRDPDSLRARDAEADLAPTFRSPHSKIAHVVFWTALFYGLAVLVAKIAEWASG